MDPCHGRFAYDFNDSSGNLTVYIGLSILCEGRAFSAAAVPAYISMEHKSKQEYLSTCNALWLFDLTEERTGHACTNYFFSTKKPHWSFGMAQLH